MLSELVDEEDVELVGRSPPLMAVSTEVDERLVCEDVKSERAGTELLVLVTEDEVADVVELVGEVKMT